MKMLSFTLGLLIGSIIGFFICVIIVAGDDE